MYTCESTTTVKRVHENEILTDKKVT